MRLKPVSLALLYAVVLLFPLQAIPEHFSGKVVSVLDGDTIEVLNQGKAERVRLNGIDCPEKSQAFGNPREAIHIGPGIQEDGDGYKTFDKDRYGRTIGDVFLPDGKSLNQELIKAGFGWWYRQYAPNGKTLQALEEDARAKRGGLWADPNPIPPWDFRKAERNSRDTAV